MAGIPGLSNIFSGTGAGLTTTFTVLKFIVYGVVVGLGGYLAWYILSFNVRIVVFERTSSGYTQSKDSGRFKADKNNPGVQNFQFLKRKKQWDQPLERSYLMTEKKAFGRIGMIVYFAEDSDGRLQPVKPIEVKNLKEWTGWNNNAMEFTTRKAKEYIDRFKKGDFWAKYGGLIQMAFLGFLLVILLVLFRQQKEVAGQLGNVAESLKVVAQSMQPIVQNSTGVQVVQ